MFRIVSEEESNASSTGVLRQGIRTIGSWIMVAEEAGECAAVGVGIELGGVDVRYAIFQFNF